MDSRLLIKMADTYSTVGDYQKAMEYLDYAEAFDPNSALIPANRGLVEFRAGDVVEARNYFEQSMEVDPTASNTLGIWGMQETGEAARARY